MLIDPQTFSVVSLFSGGGIGDVGFRRAGLRLILQNEIEERRGELCSLNFPDSSVICADIQDACPGIIADAQSKIQNQDLFLLSATPPCQGMSKNGIGTILKAMRDGKRPSVDVRNALIIPALDIVEALKPRFVFFENVDRIFNTYYSSDVLASDRPIKMVDFIKERLSKLQYFGDIHLVDFANYGIAQHRFRAVGIFVRRDLIVGRNLSPIDLLPEPTHGPRSRKNKPWLSVREAIGGLPPLDSVDRSHASSRLSPLHKVPVSRDELYRWIKYTKPERTAFENDECPTCTHVNLRNAVRCEKCSDVLPKPNVEISGVRRLIRGFVSAYKRMPWDKPAPTVTTRSAYACSDHNLHPDQNRVLSLLEACILQGLHQEEYRWGPVRNRQSRNGLQFLPVAPDTLIRDVLGEPVSPVFTHAVGQHLIRLYKNDMTVSNVRPRQEEFDLAFSTT